MISQRYNEQMGNYLAKLAKASKPPTNADRIRQMSDEELAQLFVDSYGYAPWCDMDSESWCENYSCKPCCEKWLKSLVEQEVDNG